MAKILGVGNATVDIISYLDVYPQEDSELRASSRVIIRGGNVANSLVVLAQLGHQCSWAGTLAHDHFSSIIEDDFKKYSINYDAASWHENAQTPLSCITVNAQTGSRTIVHDRVLPEYDAKNFAGLPLEQFDLVHFEGRNVEQIKNMIQQLRQLKHSPLISLEVEKYRDDIQSLFGLVDVILFSNAYINQQATVSAQEYIENMFNENKSSCKAIYCAQGEQGAWGVDHTGVRFANAVKLDKVVDTTGAGDVFNAAIIDGALKNIELNQCLQFACELAAKKCAVTGFDLCV